MTHRALKNLVTKALDEAAEAPSYSCGGYIEGIADTLYADRAIGLPDVELLISLAGALAYDRCLDTSILNPF